MDGGENMNSRLLFDLLAVVANDCNFTKLRIPVRMPYKVEAFSMLPPPHSAREMSRMKSASASTRILRTATLPRIFPAQSTFFNLFHPLTASDMTELHLIIQCLYLGDRHPPLYSSEQIARGQDALQCTKTFRRQLCLTTDRSTFIINPD